MDHLEIVDEISIAEDKLQLIRMGGDLVGALVKSLIVHKV